MMLESRASSYSAERDSFEMAPNFPALPGPPFGARGNRSRQRAAALRDVPARFHSFHFPLPEFRYCHQIEPRL